MIRIDQLLMGPIRPLGPNATPSGIAKHAVASRVRLGREGLTADEHGDPQHHGGPDKALHHYPFEHYAYWRETIDAPQLLAQPGAFGENLSASGLTEAHVAIGDVFRMGEALVEVSQGRQPCFRLNLRFAVPDMAYRVQTCGRTGWYYRVIEEGFVAAGDDLVLIDRPSPEWTIERLWRALYVDTLNAAELMAIAEFTHLPEGWRRYARRRLATAQVEDWSRRLTGKDA
jgi:MOSC domain-containing protein YiiM